MNILVPILGIAFLSVFALFKLNTLRTKMAFFFILSGVLFIVFVSFLVINGEGFDFSSIGGIFSSMRVYFLWLKGAFVNVFEFTGKVIGMDIGKNVTGVIK
ncbi:MAG TPA: hypothetical protein ENH99_01300 [Candidatus Pacearchaeota archaeon]|nr:hypothetical protein [Candidatus Pacearchaeota archaeon]